MGALIKTASKMLLGSAATNPQMVPEMVTKVGRKLYLASLLVIGTAWYTGWRRLRGEAKGQFPIPGIARKATRNVAKLSDLPALAPFKAVLPLPDTGGTDATGSSGGGGGNDLVKTPLGQLPGALGGSTATILQLGRLAQTMGLHVGENPLFGGVTPVHVTGSLHYSGRAIDVSAPMTPQGKALMAHYANVVASNYGKRLTELFWRGQNWVIIKNGVRQANFNFVDGHQDHVHVAV